MYGCYISYISSQKKLLLFLKGLSSHLIGRLKRYEDCVNITEILKIARAYNEELEGEGKEHKTLHFKT